MVFWRHLFPNYAVSIFAGTEDSGGGGIVVPIFDSGIWLRHVDIRFWMHHVLMLDARSPLYFCLSSVSAFAQPSLSPCRKSLRADEVASYKGLSCGRYYLLGGHLRVLEVPVNLIWVNWKVSVLALPRLCTTTVVY